MTKTSTIARRAALLGLLLSPGLLSLAAEDGRARGILVEQVVNGNAAFMVRVDVDHPDRVYRVGDVLQAKVRTSRPGFLYLLYLDASGNLACIFPNDVQRTNSILANQDVYVPASGDAFALRIGPPLGKEVLKAIVTTNPVSNPAMDLRRLTQKSATPLAEGTARGLAVELKNQNPGKWAEHDVEITTVAGGPLGPGGGQVTPPGGGQVTPPGGGQITPPVGPGGQIGPPMGGKRVGLFVGISRFKDQGIHPLSICDKDAQAMAGAMRSVGNMPSGQVLLNEEATLANVEQAICSRLRGETQPGDTVVIYWSGHGGRCADTNGDEKDGYDEYLVPFDGMIDRPEQTMLLDDTFGRWVQALDGRKVVLILDTCHSGGQSSREKSIQQRLGQQNQGFDYLDAELARAKDIGQKETAMLASSTASQVSFERKQGDLSVMTYVLVNLLQSGAGRMSLKELYEPLKHQVEAYVQEHFPGTTQTPILVDNTTAPIYMRQ